MRVCYNIMRNAYMQVFRMMCHCVHTSRHHHIMNLDMMMNESRLNLDQYSFRVPLDLEQIC